MESEARYSHEFLFDVTVVCFVSFDLQKFVLFALLGFVVCSLYFKIKIIADPTYKTPS